jgi:hypothetical protein
VLLWKNVQQKQTILEALATGLDVFAQRRPHLAQPGVDLLGQKTVGFGDVDAHGDEQSA